MEFECSKALGEPVSREDLRQQKAETKELRQKVGWLDMDCQKKNRQIGQERQGTLTLCSAGYPLKNFGTDLVNTSKDILDYVRLLLTTPRENFKAV